MMKFKIVYIYKDALSGEDISGEIPIKCRCPGVITNHKKKIMRKGKITKWEILINK